MIRGRLVSLIKNQAQVELDNHQVVGASVKGRMRLKDPLLVGDWVHLDCQEGQYLIQASEPRKSQLKRPAIANVDQVLIVMSSQTPDFSSLACDRMIFLSQLEGLQPILIFTKMDLDHGAMDPYIKDYEASGYPIFPVDKETPLEPLMALLKGKVSVLSGNSGVGKSTLLNRMDPSLTLKTQAISKALNRGKHTTTATRLYPLAGGWIADTPGFSTLWLDHVSPLELAQEITEFKPFLTCKFANCLHESEPDCGIKAAVADHQISPIRYQNYQIILQECGEKKR